MNKQEKATAEAVTSFPLEIHGTKVQHFSQTAKKISEKLDTDITELLAETETMQPQWKKYVHDFGNREISRPDFLVKIGGVQLMPRHELTTITGKAGQGKSYFNMIILGALLKGDVVLDVIPLRQVKRILYVDTEQSEFDVAERSNAMFRAMGWQEFTPVSTERLVYLRLRQADDNSQRAVITEEAIEDFKPHVIFLDGLTDFVKDLDDKNEASSMVARWLKLVDQTDCNVIVTIHQNEGTESTKIRELLGSEIMRKSRNIIAVNVKDAHFTARAQKGKPFTYDWRLDPFGNLTTSLSPALMASEQERKTLYDLMAKVISNRSKFDSKKQIYGCIASLSGSSSKTRNEETYERAKTLEVIFEKYDGHKYNLSLEDIGYSTDEGELRVNG